MATASIAFDYGQYKNFSYKEKQTCLDFYWEPPEELEAKFAKEFNDTVSAEIAKLEKELDGGANTARAWLLDADKELSRIEDRFLKNGVASKGDIKFCGEMQDFLPSVIKNLEEQRVKIFESQFDKMLDKATADLEKKMKKKISNAKIKKRLKIAGFALLFLGTTIAAVVATIMTFGVAAGPIIAVVGTGVGIFSSFGALTAKAKSIWGSGKDEAKNLEVAAKAYAAAATDFNKVLDRQMSQLTAKNAHLELLGKQIAEAKKTLATLDGLKKNLGDVVQKKIDAANKELLVMEKSYDAVDAELKTLEKLVADALSKKTFESALALAATAKEDKGMLDKISDTANTIGGVFSSIAGVL